VTAPPLLVRSISEIVPLIGVAPEYVKPVPMIRVSVPSEFESTNNVLD